MNWKRRRAKFAHLTCPPHPHLRKKNQLNSTQAADGTKMDPLRSAEDSHSDHLVGLATCNNAEKVGDTIVANEVEYKMFQATGWKFTSSDGVSPVVLTCGEGNAHIVHQRNDFCHSRMTQSVIVEKPCGTKEIYVKGSFETVAAFCKPESLPADYASVAQRHALAGCYVLALAKRVLGAQVRRIPLLVFFRNYLRQKRAQRCCATHRNSKLTQTHQDHSTSEKTFFNSLGDAARHADGPRRHGARPDVPGAYRLPQ